MLATLVASAPASFPYTAVVIPTNSNPVSAMNVTDYDNTPINVTFLPGKTEVDFRVPIVSDSIEEGLETFALMLEVDVNGIIYPGMPLLTEVNINEQQSMYKAEQLSTYAHIAISDTCIQLLLWFVLSLLMIIVVILLICLSTDCNFSSSEIHSLYMFIY